MQFMNVPEGKYFGKHDDNMLANFLFNPGNRPLTESFERAAGVTLGRYGACVGIVGDTARDVALAKDGLEDLSSEMRTIRPEQFESIAKKVSLLRG